MGNTQFLKADFTPYGSNSLAEQVSDAADLVQAAFAGVGPNKSQTTDGIYTHFWLDCLFDRLSTQLFTHALIQLSTYALIQSF